MDLEETRKNIRQQLLENPWFYYQMKTLGYKEYLSCLSIPQIIKDYWIDKATKTAWEIRVREFPKSTLISIEYTDSFFPSVVIYDESLPDNKFYYDRSFGLEERYFTEDEMVRILKLQGFI